MLFTDREALRTSAYADTTALRVRMSIYEYQQPRRDLRPMVTSFLTDVSAPVLDLGCGVGGYTRALRTAGHQVIAADLSAAMTTSAGAPAAVADALTLPFRSATFGAVIALHMLYHLPKPATAITEIRRLLRPGGILVVSTNAAGDKAELRRVHTDAAIAAGCPIPDHGPAEHFQLDEAESIVRDMFDTVDRHDLRSEIRVPSPEPVVAFIDSTRSWYGDGPEVMAHVSRIVSATIERDGAFVFRTHSGFLVCR